MAGCKPRDEVEAVADGLGFLSLSDRTAATVTAMASVLENDDLLQEILIRLTFSNTLVRAALVCKTWLRNVSDSAFLCRFRDLHPPFLLGFYMVADGLLHPRFVALDGHPPELGILVSRASAHFDTWMDIPITMWDCRNGEILVDICDKVAVHRPLHPPYGIAVYPQSPMKVDLDPSYSYDVLEFLPEDVGNGRDYYRLALGFKCDHIVAYLFRFTDGIWVVCKSALTQLPVLDEPATFAAPFGILGHGKLYVMTTRKIIVVVHVESVGLSMIELLQDIELEDCNDINVSPAQLEEEFYLICLHPSNLEVWLHNLCTSSWELVHSIPVHEMFGRFRTLDSEFGPDSLDDAVCMYGAGEVGEFLFLGVDNSIFLLTMKGEKVEKVYHMSPEDGVLHRVYPLMMIWLPTFPAHLMRGQAGDEIMEVNATSEVVEDEKE